MIRERLGMHKYSPISSHVISYETLVLEPFYNENRMSTKIYEGNQIYTIPLKPLHCVRKSCRHYGNSFKSATNNAKVFFSNRQKLPIIIAYESGRPIVAIPTMSAKSEYNIWIFLHGIVNFEATEGGCLIHLRHNQSIQTNVSIGTMQRQISLGALLSIEYINRYKRITGSSLHNPD